MPRIAEAVTENGYDASPVADLGLLFATDDKIFDYGAEEGFVVVTADSDFAMLLALRHSSAPSVLLLRDVADLAPAAHLEFLVANLPIVQDELDAGAIVSMSPGSVRIRDLPIA